MPAKTLNHLTLTTGHNRVSPRTEVSDAVVDFIQSWLQQGLATEERIPLPAGGLSRQFSAKVTGDRGALLVTVFRNETEPVPVFTFGVGRTQDDADRLWPLLMHEIETAQRIAQPAVPWCAVILLPFFYTWANVDDLGNWAADFERCVAWAWLELPDAPKPSAH